MSDMIFNLRIGKIHFQITSAWKVRVSINDYHRWLKWPVITLYQFEKWWKA